MTQRRQRHQNPPQHRDSSQSWAPGALCQACRQLNRLENFLSRCLIGLNHFQEAQIVSASFYQLAWSQFRLLLLQAIIILAGRGRVNLVGFRDFLKLFRVVYVPA